MENAEKKVSVSFSFKKKADTRGFVKPKEEPLKVIKEDYITCIEGDKIVSQGGGSGGGEGSSSKLVIPLPQGAKISEEPTENSYEVVPVEEFGLAMLRGMGWTENDDRIKPIETIIRPKGSGLGHLLLNRK